MHWEHLQRRPRKAARQRTRRGATPSSGGSGCPRRGRRPISCVREDLSDAEGLSDDGRLAPAALSPLLLWSRQISSTGNAGDRMKKLALFVPARSCYYVGHPPPT